MGSLFQSRPGLVHLTKSAASSVPGALVLFEDGGPAGTDKGGGAGMLVPVIITGVGYRQSVNIQFMPTLKKLVYVYAFGDRMGDIRVSGLAFDNHCDAKTANSGWGTRKILEYYERNRAIKDGQTVTILVANEAITGFLTGVEVSLANIEFKTMAFAFTLKTLPKDLS